jgi:hypothetical protein
MAFLIGGANSAADTGYDIDNSCRFDAASNPVLSFDTGTATLSTKCTLSLWFKRSKLDSGTTQYWLLGAKDTAESNIKFKADKIDMHLTGSNYDYASTRLFRDIGAWYHLVFSFDTTQGVAANRVKLWVNGEAETLTTSGGGAIPQNDVVEFNKASLTHTLGAHGDSDHPSDGYMAEVYFVDGTAYDADDFGEADSDSGIWKPKSASVTFGNNGYYMEFKESAVGSGSASTIGADTSGETNHLTSAGLATTDQCTDTPTNNFCTINPLHFGSAVGTVAMSEGNAIFSSSGSDTWRSSTMAVSKGKWYAEFKVTGTATAGGVGINNGIQTAYIGSNSYDYIFGFSGVVYNNDADAGGSFAAPATNDIDGVAVDLDNNKIYWSENGTFLNSGDPTSGATGTGAISVSSTNPSGFYHFAVGDAGGGTVTFECNFGNPAFTISSGNADANGYGNFEYAPPSGYYALCTKNLAEFG